MIICIDGPAASGKSTVASKLARKLGLIHLNSGALFRAVALESMRSAENVADIARRLDFKFVLQSDQQTKLFVNDVDVGGKLDSQEIAEVASRIAVIPELREELLNVQRGLFKKVGSLVAEGRDAGSVVFPGADFKFYLEASLEERTRRRHSELSSKFASTVDQLKQEIVKRDTRDQNREHAPQKPAADAIVVNTDGKSVEQVVELILKKIKG